MAKKQGSRLQVTKQESSENSVFSLSPPLSQFTHLYLAVRQSKKRVIPRSRFLKTDSISTKVRSQGTQMIGINMRRSEILKISLKEFHTLYTYRLPGLKFDPDTGTDEKLSALN